MLGVPWSSASGDITYLHFAYIRTFIWIHKLCPGKYENEWISKINYFYHFHALTHKNKFQC